VIRALNFALGGLSAAVMVFGSGCANTPHPARLRLDGGFIQYQGWMMKLDAPGWQQELDAMRKAGMRIIILQQLQQGDWRFIPDSPQAPDPTQIILNYADARRMQVFIGLANDSGWWKSRHWNDYLDSAAARNMALADEIWKRYGTHRSFAGWYLPQEMWEGPFTDEQIAQARSFFRRVSDHCKSLSKNAPKPVAISPFHKARVTPDEVEKLYTDFLRGAGVDILMLQDGVGAKGWDDMIEEKVVPYFAAFGRACRASQVEFWANVECFKSVGTTLSGVKELAPADAGRLNRQMTAVAPYVRRLVTFDFFHYMSPFRQDERARKLYDGYLKLKVED